MSVTKQCIKKGDTTSAWKQTIKAAIKSDGGDRFASILHRGRERTRWWVVGRIKDMRILSRPSGFRILEIAGIRSFLRTSAEQVLLRCRFWRQSRRHYGRGGLGSRKGKSVLVRSTEIGISAAAVTHYCPNTTQKYELPCANIKP